METILDSGHTWFLECVTQFPDGKLVIRLAEGLKGSEKQPVNVGEKVIGEFFPVTVEPTSRVAEVRFADCLVLLAYNESYDTSDETLVTSDKGKLRRVEQSTFQTFVGQSTNAITLGNQPLGEFRLWTENQVFQVFASGSPEVELLSQQPDPSIERYNTWYAG
ncbi:MAG: hypothetical protein CVV12_07230 [Gammaproteobacteria bacterium HGW-Gammaproteobacteria-2]|jgi:hypothetical protein|nr:MAG: hypothetical protein CVV12_07230 [Gammaproteobacteria bacterium HGW-Gammaproteobacteria-2]